MTTQAPVAPHTKQIQSAIEAENGGVPVDWRAVALRSHDLAATHINELANRLTEKHQAGDAQIEPGDS